MRLLFESVEMQERCTLERAAHLAWGTSAASVRLLLAVVRAAPALADIADLRTFHLVAEAAKVCLSAEDGPSVYLRPLDEGGSPVQTHSDDGSLRPDRARLARAALVTDVRADLYDAS